MIIKKVLKVFGVIILCVIMLIAVASTLLYVPFIQRWAVEKAVNIAKENTGYDFNVESLRLAFPFDLSIKDVYLAKKDSSLCTDTIANVGSIKLRVRLLPLTHLNVVVDKLDIKDLQLDTKDLVSTVRIKGNVGHLALKSRSVNIKKETVDVKNLDLQDAQVNVYLLKDTTEKDTASSPTMWQIGADAVNIERTNFNLYTANDSTQLATYIKNIEIKDVNVDLEKGIYGVLSVELNDSQIDLNTGKDQDYAQENDEMAQQRQSNRGIDFSHLSLSDVNIRLDSIKYSSTSSHVRVENISFKEQSGIQFTQLSTTIDMDSLNLSVPDLSLITSDSQIDLELNCALNALDSINPGQINMRLRADIGKQDILTLLSPTIENFAREYPNEAISIKTIAYGTTKHLEIPALYVTLPSTLTLSLEGYINNITDTKNLDAELNVTSHTGNLDFITALISENDSFSIPQGMSIDATVSANKKCYSLEFALQEDSGQVNINASYNAPLNAYTAQMDVKELDISHILPHDSIGKLSIGISVDGAGTDIFASDTRLSLSAQVDSLYFSPWEINNISVEVKLENGRARAVLLSKNPLADATLTLKALINNEEIKTSTNINLNTIDLYALGITNKKIVAGTDIGIRAKTNLNDNHYVDLNVNNIKFRTSKNTLTTKDLYLTAKTDADTTWARASSGSMNLNISASKGYKDIIEQSKVILNEALTQIEEKTFNQPVLREILPIVNLNFTIGNDDPISNFLKFSGITFDLANLYIHTSPQKGINTSLNVHSLKIDSTQFDTIRLRIHQEDDNILFDGIVRNTERCAPKVFLALINGTIFDRSFEVEAKMFDKENKLGIHLGTRAEIMDSSLHVTLLPDKPILGFKTFSLNDDNKIVLKRGSPIVADIHLNADDGTTVDLTAKAIGANPMLQEASVNLFSFDLGKITEAIPFAPSINGALNSDIHILQERNGKLAVNANLDIDGLEYEKSIIGNIGAKASYVLKEDSTQNVKLTIQHNKNDVGILQGVYYDDKINATFDLKSLPLTLINTFLPRETASLDGQLKGSLSIKGTLDQPIIDGQVTFDSTWITSRAYGLRMRFDDKPIRITGSNLAFENYNIYSASDERLNINGNVDFSNTDDINLNLRVMARDYQLINTKQTRNSVVYGNAYIDLSAILSGKLDNMKLKGDLNVLGKTDMTYILKDSPLNTDDEFKDIVTFTDFRDTTAVIVEKEAEQGAIDISMTINIEEGARIFCALNDAQTNYLDVMGGGELRFTYPSTGDMKLTGRYSIVEGSMKYQLPIIPLKTFSLEEGSYVEFNGEVTNPTFNISATEEVKTLVSSEDGTSRSVKFKCGVKVTQTLDNMGLEFTLEAPEDLTIANELASKSAEDRGKIAVTMLATGMYIGDGNSGDFSMNSALNAFLQSEINNITNSATKSVDISLSMDQNADATGNTYTDYSFKFAKRLWSNRVNLVIGGKVSDNSNNAVAEEDQSFIDNVSLEYRLDNSAMRYLRLFYEKESYDMLEGYISEYGAGFIWKKKAQLFRQLFNFRSNDRRKIKKSQQSNRQANTTLQMPSDSLRVRIDSTIIN